MSFFYEGDQLHYRKDIVSGEKVSKSWTIVDLPYRSPGELPNLPSFTAFLTQSFTLIPLLEVDLEVDGIQLLSLRKVVGPGNNLPIPSHLNRRSPNGFLTLNSLEVESFQVKVKYMNVTQISNESLFSKSSNIFSFGKRIFSSLVTSSTNPSDITEVVCFLRKVTGIVDVSVSASFAAKMKATVMKAPAKKAIISMLAYNREEKEQSELTPPLSDYIFPKEFSDAKIYIGFPTKQSTSMRSHICMNQLIPTMERTAVDMSNQHVKDWNEQMLYMSGVLSRTIYENEMTEIAKTYSSSQLENLLNSACYIINRFEFERSTPDPVVGNWISGGFWNSSPKLSLPSQKGIKLSNEIRVPGTANFIRDTPILPTNVASECPKFIERAIELGFLKKISVEDILEEIQGHTLTPVDLKNLIVWCVDEGLNKKILTLERVRSVLDVAVVTSDNGGSDSKNCTVILRGVNSYQNKFTIEMDLPLPPTCIPYKFIKDIPWSTLDTLGWHELETVEWLSYLVKTKNLPLEHNLSISPEFAVKVLQKISTNWNSFSNVSQKTVKDLLQNETCIPTQLGMKLPSESYLIDIPLFPNLPVKSPQLTADYRFLFNLGLRESVDMAFVLKLLHDPESSSIKWSTVDMVKYLTDNRKSLKTSDWQLLKEKAFFEAYDSEKKSAPKVLYKASDLYAPNPLLISLGFRTLKWNYWVDSSPEATLLFDIGLLRCPTESQLFKVAISESKIKIAIDYFITNSNKNGYSSLKTSLIADPFIPCKLNGLPVYKAPKDCFTDQRVEQFGLPIVRDELLVSEGWKFGIRKAPNMSELVHAVKHRPPESVKAGELMFTYLSTVVSEISEVHIKEFQSTAFIPIGIGKDKLKYQHPSKTFLEATDDGSDSGDDDAFFKDFFDFVNMPPSAIPFLLKVGVRYNPSILEIAQAAVDDPKSMYQLASSNDRYESFLGRLADAWPNLSKNKELVSAMRTSPFLLSLSYKGGENEDLDDDGFIYREKAMYTLAPASDIVIVDDVISFNLFKSYLKIAPQDSKLERLYASLGSLNLSKLVERSIQIGAEINMNDPVIQKRISNIKTRIVERVKLFLEGTEKKAKIRPSAIKEIKIIPVSRIQLRRRINSRSVRSPVLSEDIKAYMESRRTLFVDLEEFDWFDVSQALVKEILEKPTPDSVIVLELQLKSDLRSLQRKGYNVDRLLRQKQMQDVKLLEERERAKQEAKRKLLEEKYLEKDESQEVTIEMNDKNSDKFSPVPSPPAPLPVTAEGQHQAQPQPETPPQPQQLQKQSQQQPQAGHRGFLDGLKSSILKFNKRDTREHHNQLKPSSEPLDLLRKGLSSARPFSQGVLLASSHVDVAPPQELMACDDGIVHDLQFVTQLKGGLKCFVKSNQPGLVEVQLKEAERFQHILFACSKVSYCVDMRGRLMANIF